LTGDDRHLTAERPSVPRPQGAAPERRAPTAGPPADGQPRSARGGGATGLPRGTRGPIDAGKRNVLGVLVDALDYDAAIAKILAAARERHPLSLTALAVHGVLTGVHDPRYNARLSAFDVVAPDGQPVRWALNILHGTRLPDWVSGPELVLRVLRRMAADGLPVYLYGTTPQTLARLSASLRRMFPELRIAGAEPSKFRAAQPGEAAAVAARIRASGARLVLVGLGCPRQEVFVYGMRPLVGVPLLAVGAAFDYHAGRLRPAPLWMQRRGLAWLWRLGLEPRRLWRRYLIPNLEYLVRLALQKARLWRPEPPVPAVQAPESVPL
jgi:N-acetylglucosaminyldiphosphoundecaprenol N-acetyl-beta-D-mannosaminyltransferase